MCACITAIVPPPVGLYPFKFRLSSGINTQRSSRPDNRAAGVRFYWKIVSRPDQFGQSSFASARQAPFSCGACSRCQSRSPAAAAPPPWVAPTMILNWQHAEMILGFVTRPGQVASQVGPDQELKSRPECVGEHWPECCSGYSCSCSCCCYFRPARSISFRVVDSDSWGCV